MLVAIRFVYSGGLILQERDTNNAVTSRNTWGMGLPGGGGALLARSLGSNHYYYHDDGRGNVAAVTDGSQVLRAFYAWDAYGSKNTATVNGQYTQQSQPYQFATKWRHVPSGLTYFGARFYDAQLGRFINRDPIGEAGGVNLFIFYAYEAVFIRRRFLLPLCVQSFQWFPKLKLPIRTCRVPSL